MDKINFANPHSPYQELQLARWYTSSCILLISMLVCIGGGSFLQWRRYQQAMRMQKNYLAHDALAQECAELQTQRSSCQIPSNRPPAKQQLAALSQSMGKEMRLIECVIAADGAHTLTITAPSRQRAQECITALNQKKLFGRLAITSLKTVQNGEKSHLLVRFETAPSTGSG